MSITCSICAKTQSGWLQDFPLSKDYSDERICIECKFIIQGVEPVQIRTMKYKFGSNHIFIEEGLINVLYVGATVWN